MANDVAGTGHSRAGSDGGQRLPAWKADLVETCTEIDGVVTEIEKHRYGHTYHAALEDEAGTVWLATIETDSGENLDRDERKEDVTFRKCHPGADAHVLYSWSTVAVKRSLGPSDLGSWRTLMQVFHAADELLRTHDKRPEEVED